MFASLQSLVRQLRVPSVEELELSYLEGSYDRVNLEYRQREIDRGLFRDPRYY